MRPLRIDGAPDQDPKNLEQAWTLCKEQTGAFEYHRAPRARWGPRSRANWPLQRMGLINNRRAHSETMGPLELAGVPDAELFAMLFFVREIDL